MTVQEMLEYQKRLQDKYEEQWGGLSPEVGRSQLLWGIGEIGEVIDIIKKQGDRAIMENPETREHFIEEMGDVFMYLFDVLLCYDISAEDFERIYRKKQERNFHRWE